MKATRYAPCLLPLFFAFAAFAQSNSAIIDFEFFPDGSTPTEGMSISNQFAAAYGVSFRCEDGSFPRLAKADSANFIAFTQGSGNTPNHMLANQNCGRFFLTSKNGDVQSQPVGSLNLIITYANPIASASGAILDIDGNQAQGGNEAWNIQAYNGTTLLEVARLRVNSPNAGDGLATPWSFNHPVADITSIKILYVGEKYEYIGLAFDNFSPAQIAPTQLSLTRTQNVSKISLSGPYGQWQRYSIQYAGSIQSTNWQTLTNLWLTNSPVQLISEAATTNSSRFYRAVVTSPPCVSAPSNVVAWWPGEDSAQDIATTNHGTVPTNGVTYLYGMSGRAFNFDGTNGFIQTPLDVQPSAMTNTTWEAWILPTRPYHTVRQAIFSTDDGGSDRQVLLVANTDPDLTETPFGIATGSALWQPVGATANQWQHIAVVYSKTNILFFKNGKRYAYGSAPTTLTTTNRLFIGKNPGFGQFFQGLIDEPAIYNRALTDAEIQAIYNAGPAGKCKP